MYLFEVLHIKSWPISLLITSYLGNKKFKRPFIKEMIKWDGRYWIINKYEIIQGYPFIRKVFVVLNSFHVGLFPEFHLPTHARKLSWIYKTAKFTEYAKSFNGFKT